MSRILLLIVLVLWMARSAGPSAPLPAAGAVPVRGLVTFLAGMALIVLFMGLWSRMLARRVSGQNLNRSLQSFTRAMHIARVMIPAWFAVGLFALGWGRFVEGVLGPLSRWPIELPGALLGTLPALLAWMGLWWAQHPADRAFREQTVLIHLNEGLPVHSLPGFWGCVWSNFRLQILFTLMPVGLILLIRDVACMILWRAGVVEVLDGAVYPQSLEVWITLGALATVFVFVPEILRHVLKTEPLPPSALRNRLEALCRRSRLRYRQILLWHTDHTMANAAVMGILPHVRYVLLSDLLLETMSDSQIEAVFAHEIGHVVHRHMAWYVVFLAIIISGMVGPGQWIERQLGSHLNQSNVRDLVNLLTVVAGCGGFFFLFGCLSRWFERQADVYAARTMQQHESREGPPAASSSYVGPYGAQLFASALQRVAAINNIPLTPQPAAPGGIARAAAVVDSVFEKANNWFHGSIPSRMGYLRGLSSDPRRTGEFDRAMGAVYSLLLAALLLSGTSLILTLL